jgi:hypothetical protein
MNPVYTFQAYQFDEASYPRYIRAREYDGTFEDILF